MSSVSAFQSEAAVFDEGDYGGDGVSAGYGDLPYGGGDASWFLLPEVNIGSDDPLKELHVMVHEALHQRLGKTIGSRFYASTDRWRFIYDFLSEAEVESFRGYFLLRKFRFIKNVTDEQTFRRVHWMGREFRPESLRGGRYRLEFEIEEIS